MKFNKFLIGIVFIFLIVNVCGLEIVKVEMNPLDDCMDCTEWAELYSEEEINLEQYYFENSKGTILELSGKDSGNIKIEFGKRFLTNSGDKLILKKEDEVIDETSILKDNENNEKLWIFCNNEWYFGDQCSEKEDNEKQKENDGIDEPDDNQETPLTTNLDSDTPITTNIINLNPQQEIESKDNKIIYESKNEKIKNYSIYVFALFLVFIIILLLIKD